jgi:DNA-binding NarL/FixJ family response regulator
MTNTEIAGKLRISPATVKRHVSSILGKLGLPSRLHAAVYAAQRDVA